MIRQDMTLITTHSPGNGNLAGACFGADHKLSEGEEGNVYILKGKFFDTKSY